ncbi:MAG: SOS response-associated peptidase [Acidimicrobiales bacterium]|nr:SOS response-associated peptidase [Acidimicrobiales bacterium]
MCGRFVSATPPDQLAAYFGVDALTERVVDAAPEPNFNVAPTTGVYTVTERDDERILDTYRWGLVPFWAKDPSVGSRMINARAETVATKNAFRKLIVSKRCIIPADGFYEWRVLAPESELGEAERKAEGTKRRGTKAPKQPVFIHRVDGEPLAFAGLWDRWVDAEGHELRSCTIITTAANPVIEPIHDRMPVVLPPDSWSTWLDPDVRDLDVVTGLLVAAPEELLVWHPVSTEVNSVRNKGPQLIEAVAGAAGGSGDANGRSA